MAGHRRRNGDQFLNDTRRRINEQQRGGTSTKAPKRSQILQSSSPQGRALAADVISPFLPLPAATGVQVGEQLTRPSAVPFAGGTGTSALDALTPERLAFERAAQVSLDQAGRLASGRGQAMGQAFASAGLAGSPLATSQIANQRRLADQSALERVTQARFGLESGIAGREFQQSVLDQQQSQFDRQQRNAFIAIGAEIGFGLIDDFLFDELKGLVDFDELFGTNDVGTNIDIPPGAESRLFA